MKKVLLLVAMVCMGFFANAQLYVGGGLGVDFGSTKPKEGDKSKDFGFFISPEVGYSLNDKMDVGVNLSLGVAKYERDIWDGINGAFDNLGLGDMDLDWDDVELAKELKLTTWQFAPYFRYSLVEFGKFKVLGKASLYVLGGKGTLVPHTGNIEPEYKITQFGLNVTPMLTYDLSEKFVLFTDLNFLSLGFSSSKMKIEVGDFFSDENTNTGFNLGVDANNAYNVGAITVGFAYKF